MIFITVERMAAILRSHGIRLDADSILQQAQEQTAPTAQDAALQALSDSEQEIENLEGAQNYRWLRDRAVLLDHSCNLAWFVIGTCPKDCRTLGGAEIDAVIAQARAADAASR